MHQRADHQAVADFRPARPARAGRERDEGHDDHHDHHAHGEEGQRLDIGQREARTDEPGAPQQHE